MHITVLNLEVQYLSVRFLTLFPVIHSLQKKAFDTVCFDVLTLLYGFLVMHVKCNDESTCIFFGFSRASITLCVKSLQRCLSSLKLVTMQAAHWHQVAFHDNRELPAQVLKCNNGKQKSKVKQEKRKRTQSCTF